MDLDPSGEAVRHGQGGFVFQRFHTKESPERTDSFRNSLMRTHSNVTAAEGQPVLSILVHEDTVNAVLIFWLVSLCMGLESPLRWELNKPRFTLQLGKAHIVAVADGQLVGPHGDICAIVEVKRQTLRSSPAKALRQMGIEKIVMALQPVAEYFNSLGIDDSKASDSEISMDEKTEFLNLKLMGPF
ncbi:hypothetical protein ASPZODRAFT_11477 [Penicilliopsis zonata CBS 506.65]|uniref:Uncharacterized protein n=1 Tax=Penicilliopsis zonata CBS 506.65 TaxID=1073090 RepID=A0A1L9SU17_9EURO|nr:hypothetical protein ASPZODRAFT_11477 [Penicilliopsis zonata CBS 506.65]OJJ50611.1 hypothetical protein ASPZODRAFT_11477 [Penicilliopsis zonata CBS 506.65]